jgi:uncharacterized protein YecT (DUF1311 family)
MNVSNGRAKLYLFGVVLLFAVSHSASVLAIDCTIATSKIDKAICSDSGLSNQDAQLNEDYGGAMNKLSPEGQAALRADQRDWLRYREAACGYADGNGDSGSLLCLGRSVHRRDDGLLWLVAHQQGPSPYIFSVKSSYVTTPNPAGGLPFWSESSIPQIDHNALSEGVAWSDAEAWNALIAKLVGSPVRVSVCPGGKGDVYREPHVYFASMLLISMTENRDDSCRVVRPALLILTGKDPFPQDHFMSETQYNIVMMRGDVHQLEPDDLFLPGDGWKRLLTASLQREVQEVIKGHPDDSLPSADVMEKVATNPSNWTIGRGALGIRVNETALPPNQFIGMFTVTVPWSDLQGVLSFKGKRILNAPTW